MDQLHSIEGKSQPTRSNLAMFLNQLSHALYLGMQAIKPILTRHGSTLVRIIGSLLFIYFIISYAGVDGVRILSMFRDTNYLYVFLSLFSLLLIYPLMALKWGALLSLQAVRIPLRILAILYWIGAFFNVVIPGRYGGDVFRAYALFKHTKQVGGTISVVLDRLSGIAVLFMLAILASLINYSLVGANFLLAISLVFVVFLILVALFFTKSIYLFIANLVHRFGLFNLERQVLDLIEAVHSYKRQSRSWLNVFALTLIAQVLSVLTCYFGAVALGIALPFGYFLLLMPPIFLTALLPISINGIGVQDSAYVFFFSKVGVGASEALSMSILYHLLRTALDLLGGIIYLARR
ncbi:MAG: flippase-like domain-containing protein [Chloroflexi bacterium]|nr:flippase-like domain-containing protein [Chloroflexota bacterium]MCL5075276.1 flippase-like domain-containing protein [Chloroflexota bacterium]